MEKIDYGKNLTFGTILKLVIPSHIIILGPLMAWLVYGAYTGTATVTVNGERVYGEEAQRVATMIGVIIPFFMTLASSVAIKAMQPVNEIGSKFALFSVYGFMFKKMLQFGYWLLSMVMTPSIKYTKSWRED